MATDKNEQEQSMVAMLRVSKENRLIQDIFLFAPSQERCSLTTLRVGRHPDCDIVVDHPSISRCHLQLDLNFNLQLRRISLSLRDLSSVHGTWVRGCRIPPGFSVTLQHLDTFQIGASTRLYTLHCLLSSAPPPLQQNQQQEELNRNAVDVWARRQPRSDLMPLQLQRQLPDSSAQGSCASGCADSDKENATAVALPLSLRQQQGRLPPPLHRAPLQSLPSPSSNSKAICNCSEPHKGFFTKWYMLADAECLTNESSMRALRKLQGLKATQLVIPKLVVRELDYMKMHDTKGEMAEQTLKWVEECMRKCGSWIHVQNSCKCAPTSPTSPSSSSSSELPLSPTVHDQLLDSVLSFKTRLQDHSARVVLLTNDVALKVSAMAEGVLCETAVEFCESLVSPYSERFLWPHSTAHGPQGRIYSGFAPVRKSHAAERITSAFAEAKGLQIVLQHNSSYAQL